LSHFASSKVPAQAKFGTLERLKRDESAAKLKNTGAECHPNSHQRMMSFEGAGDMQVRAGLESSWQSNVLGNDPKAPLERRWVSIPQNIWHQPVVPKGADWVVVSFHTIPAEELIEERPDLGSAVGTKQMVYLSKK